MADIRRWSEYVIAVYGHGNPPVHRPRFTVQIGDDERYEYDYTALTPEQIEAVSSWIADHGVNCDHVPLDSVIHVGAVTSIECYVYDEDGRMRPDGAGGAERIRHVVSTVRPWPLPLPEPPADDRGSVGGAFPTATWVDETHWWQARQPQSDHTAGGGVDVTSLTTAHELSDRCAGWHCYMHNVDEDHVGAYIWCRECGHVYRTRWHLLWAYWRRRWQDRALGRPWRVRPSGIFFCQECSHDF